MIFKEMAQREAPQLVPLHRRLVTETSPFLAARYGAAARQPVEKRQHSRISQRTGLRHKLPHLFNVPFPDFPEGIQAHHFQRRGKFAFSGQGYFLSSRSA